MYKPDKIEQRAIERRKQIVLNLIGKQGKGKRLLELGPGTGALLLELKKRGFRVEGLDINLALIKKTGLDIKKGDLNKGIPFKSSTFDVVVALEVLEHTFNPFFVMKEIKRVLKKGGYAIISMPNDYSLSHKLSFLFLKQPKEFDIYGHHYSLGIDAIKFLISKELKIEQEIYCLYFRKFTFLNPIAKFLVKLNKNLFARNIFVKAVKT